MGRRAVVAAVITVSVLVALLNLFGAVRNFNPALPVHVRTQHDVLVARPGFYPSPIGSSLSATFAAAAAYEAAEMRAEVVALRAQTAELLTQVASLKAQIV